MSVSVDPTLRELNDCGCCEGIATETPTAVTNRPALSAVAYRIGQHATFKASMLAALSTARNAGLQALKTRAEDDFTIALTDALATTLDVLTFYQERIANESYLRTATERLSVLHLARLLGYELRPGVAASASLAFTLDETAGAPEALTLTPGLKVQSIPGPDEQPQTFETVEPIEARPAWNAIRPRLTAPQTLSAGMGTLWLAGTDANLRTGDRVLIVGAAAGSGFEGGLRRVQRIDRDDLNKRTQITLEPLDYGPTAVTATAPGVWALRAKVAPFGHNAPKKPDPTTPADLSKAAEWPLDGDDTTDLTLLSLDATYDQITADTAEGWVVIDRPWSFYSVIGIPLSAMFEMKLVRGVRAASPAAMVSPSLMFGPSGLTAWLAGSREQIFARAKTVRTFSRASYGITGRVTQLTLDAAWLKDGDASLSVLRDTAVYTQAERLTPAEAPLSEVLPTNNIELVGDYAALLPKRMIIITGQLIGSAADSPSVSELVEIKSMTPAGGFTTLALTRNLTHSFRRDSVTLNANVAPATHGETVSEVLGSGNGSRPYQRFTLHQAPLTHTSAETPSGTETSLQVRVNDVLWHEAPTLFRSGSHDRIYTARTGDDGKVTLLFGDGRTGARLPTGTENVRATYRKGIGRAGNVKPGQLSLLLTRPLGVRAALNPLPAAGGDDPETLERARRNAPLTVLTLDRIVSLRDYEDFARAFGGIAKALATWTWDGQRQGVFVTVAGVDGAALDENGRTFKNLVAAMHGAGDPYVPLRVKSYAEAGFRLAGVVTRHPDYLSDKVEADVRVALLRYFAFDARAFGQPVALSEVMAAIQAVPGVVAVDIDALHRLDLVGGAGLQMRLPAAAPQPGGTTSPAELLTLAADDIDLAVA